MTTEYMFLEILKEEVLDRFSQIDPSVNKHKTLGKPDFRRMSEILIKTQQDRVSAFRETYTNRKEGEADKWRDTNFQISPVSFGRLYSYGYKLSNHKRSQNTVNILAIFLEYEGWKDFIEKKRQQFKIGVEIFEKTLVDLVERANDIEYTAYKNLPAINVDAFRDHFILEGGAFMRIHNVLVQHSKKKWVLSNPGNPSHHYAHRIWVERVYGNKATVKTQEDWYLRWFDLNIKKYVAIYNEPNIQTWTLQLVDDKWKVLYTEYPPPKNFVRITHLVIANVSKNVLNIIKRFLSNK